MEDATTNEQSEFLSNRFESLVENGLDGVIIISATGETTYVSRSIKNILGYTPEEVMRMNVMDFVHPDDIKESQETILKAIENPGKPMRGRVERIRHKDGSWRWLDAVVTNMLHDPAINGIVDNFRDVTEQFLAEKKANESIERLLQATKGAKIGIWEQDLTTNEIVADEIIAELYGLEKQSSVQELEAWLHFVHPDDRETVKRKLEEVVLLEADFHIDFRIIQPNGSIRYLKSIAHLQKASKGKSARIIGTNWDVTEAHNATEKFKNLVETAPDAMVIFDEGKTIKLVNSETEKMFGYSRSELIEEPFEKLLISEIQNIPLQTNTSKSSKLCFQNSLLSNLIARRSDKTEFPVEINLGRIQTGDGSLFSAVIRDITQRKKNEVMQLKMAALEAKNEEMEQLAYITSHDLREPLLTLKKYSEVLQEMFKEEIGDEGKILLETIIRSANRMEERIGDLLNYSQLGQNKSLELVDCNQIVERVIEDLNSLIEAKQAKISVSDMPSRIRAYPLELELIFQNLINNAIKFHKKESTPEVRISSSQKEDGWCFTVSDNGIGIREKDFTKIFSIFKKLNNNLEYQGSGIGLAQVKKLVELHSGSVKVNSEIGKGTTFTFSIKTDNL